MCARPESYVPSALNGIRKLLVQRLDGKLIRHLGWLLLSFRRKLECTKRHKRKTLLLSIFSFFQVVEVFCCNHGLGRLLLCLLNNFLVIVFFCFLYFTCCCKFSWIFVFSALTIVNWRHYLMMQFLVNTFLTTQLITDLKNFGILFHWIFKICIIWLNLLIEIE